MLIFDELKKNDPQLRLVAMVLAGGLGILLAGLWWVQIVSANEYKSHLETQAYRTIRIPAVRGKILDREGRVLAENRPRYNLSLYLDDLRKPFDAAYGQLRKSALAAQQQAIAAQEKKLGRSLTKIERKQFAFTTAQIQQLRAQARLTVAGNLTAQIGRQLGQPLAFDAKNFERAYQTRLALPYPVLKNADVTNVARFEEKCSGGPGADLELESARIYPCGTTAAHVLGYLQRNDKSAEGEESYFSYRLPDYFGQVGVEGGFDSQLRGHAGSESVQVNNLGYRQSENILDQPEPGHNLVLTLDLDLQRAAEASLVAHRGVNPRAAILVMDVHTGDVLAMVSSPAIDPNYYDGGLSPEEFQKATALKNDPKLKPEINRATYENYIPGSIFKPIVGLAALENGLDPNEIYRVQPDPDDPAHGCIFIGSRHKIKDTVHPGPYNFRRAIQDSSNSYFIYNGLRTGIEKIVRLGEKFHLGEREKLPTFQDAKGTFPTLERIKESDWHDGDSANIFFGQGEVAVTPMQVAVAYSAIANGGTVLWPRLVEKITPQDPAGGEATTTFPSGVVRDQIGVSQRSLKILYDAMLSETEDPEGSGYPAFHQPGSLLNLRVCGKTGTAQVWNERNQLVLHNYWFASFAPYEHPKYAVVVMVSTDMGGSGGIVCAPIAHDIYEAILKKEKSNAARTLAAAN
jgi:penicillin-binding protein 2